MFEGLMVAMVTPFRGSAPDLDGTDRIIEFMLGGGVEGLVISGSTGEAATCTLEQSVQQRIACRICQLVQRERGKNCCRPGRQLRGRDIRNPRFCVQTERPICHRRLGDRPRVAIDCHDLSGV